METVTKPIIGQAAICEDGDAVIAPGPRDTYMGVAGHLLADISILARQCRRRESDYQWFAPMPLGARSKRTCRDVEMTRTFASLRYGITLRNFG
jgi:hypothetical protein